MRPAWDYTITLRFDTSNEYPWQIEKLEGGRTESEYLKLAKLKDVSTPGYLVKGN